MHQFIQSIKIYNPTGNNVEGLKFEFFPGQPLHFVGDGSYCLTCKESDNISIPSTCFFYNGTNYPNVDNQGVITNAINTISSPLTEIYFSFLYTYKNSDNTVGTGNIFSVILNNLGKGSNWRIIFGNIYDWQTYPDDKLKYDISLNPPLTGMALFYNSSNDYIDPFYVDINVSNMSITDLQHLSDGTELSWDYLTPVESLNTKNSHFCNDDLIYNITPFNTSVQVDHNAPIIIQFDKNLSLSDINIPDEFDIYVSNEYLDDTWLQYKCRKNTNYFIESSTYPTLYIHLTENSILQNTNIVSVDKNTVWLKTLDSGEHFIKIPANIFTTSTASNHEIIFKFNVLGYWDEKDGKPSFTGGTGATAPNDCSPDPNYPNIVSTGRTGGTGACGTPNGYPGLPGYYGGGTGGTGGVCFNTGDTGGTGDNSSPITPLQQITFDVTSSSALTINNKRLIIDLSSTPLKPNTKYVLHVEDGAILSMSDDVIKVADIHFTTGSR